VTAPRGAAAGGAAYAALVFCAVMLTAVATSGGLAHVLQVAQKMPMDGAEYIVAQQLYAGWDRLGFAIFGALIATSALAFIRRGPRRMRIAGAVAATAIALGLVVFFTFTFPVNRATANWTALPPDWQALRATWEYSHAVGAALDVTALSALVVGLLPRG
jgi:hypothetical protein